MVVSRPDQAKPENKGIYGNELFIMIVSFEELVLVVKCWSCFLADYVKSWSIFVHQRYFNFALVFFFLL